MANGVRRMMRRTISSPFGCGSCLKSKSKPPKTNFPISCLRVFFFVFGLVCSNDVSRGIVKGVSKDVSADVPNEASNGVVAYSTSLPFGIWLPGNPGGIAYRRGGKGS